MIFSIFHQSGAMDCGSACQKKYFFILSLETLRNYTYAGKDDVSLLGTSWVAEKFDFHTVDGNANGKKIETWGGGNLETDERQNSNYSAINKNDAYILTTSLYQKYDFSENKMLETILIYNMNDNNTNGERNETYPDNFYDYLFKYVKK